VDLAPQRLGEMSLIIRIFYGVTYFLIVSRIYEVVCKGWCAEMFSIEKGLSALEQR